MTAHTITEKQMQGVLVLFWLGSLVVIGGNRETKQDYWIAILISTVLFLPMVALYVRLIKLYPGMGLFEILFDIFGKIAGRIIALLYVLFAAYLGATILKYFSLFIRVVSLPKTPEAAACSMMILPVILSVVNGPDNIGRVAKASWKFLVFFILFTSIAGVKDMRLFHLFPVMDTDFKVILGSSFSLFSLPFAEAFICLSLFPGFESKGNPLKIFLKSLGITVAILLCVALRNILILGADVSNLFYFPSYNAISVIALGDFFSRFEVLVGVNLMLAGFTKASICLYTSSSGLAKILNIKEYQPLVAPCALIFLCLSQMMFSSAQDLIGFVGSFKLYSAPMEVILPAATLIGAEIRHRVKSNGSGPENRQAEAAGGQTPENA